MRACALRTQGGFLSRFPAALPCRWRRSSRPPCLAGCAPARADNSRARRGAGRHPRKAGCGQRRIPDAGELLQCLARLGDVAIQRRAQVAPPTAVRRGMRSPSAHRAQSGDHAACLERVRRASFSQSPGLAPGETPISSFSAAASLAHRSSDAGYPQCHQTTDRYGSVGQPASCRPWRASSCERTVTRRGVALPMECLAAVGSAR